MERKRIQTHTQKFAFHVMFCRLSASLGLIWFWRSHSAKILDMLRRMVSCFVLCESGYMDKIHVNINFHWFFWSLLNSHEKWKRFTAQNAPIVYIVFKYSETDPKAISAKETVCFDCLSIFFALMAFVSLSLYLKTMKMINIFLPVVFIFFVRVDRWLQDAAWCSPCYMKR